MSRIENRAKRQDIRIPLDLYEQIQQIAIDHFSAPIHHKSGKPEITATLLELVKLGIQSLNAKDTDTHTEEYTDTYLEALVEGKVKAYIDNRDKVSDTYTDIKRYSELETLVETKVKSYTDTIESKLQEISDTYTDKLAELETRLNEQNQKIEQWSDRQKLKQQNSSLTDEAAHMEPLEDTASGSEDFWESLTIRELKKLGYAWNKKHPHNKIPNVGAKNKTTLLKDFKQRQAEPDWAKQILD